MGDQWNFVLKELPSTMEFGDLVLAGFVATALGIPVGDVFKWLLWKLIAVVGDCVVLGWGHVGATLNTTPGVQISESNANGVQTSESSPNGDARADLNDHTDPESGLMTILDVNDHIDPKSGEIANVANGEEPSLEDHNGNNYSNYS